MKNLTLTLLLIISSVLATAQNNIRSLSDFNTLKVASAFNVELIQGNTNKVEITGVPEQYLDNVVTEVTNNQLSIYAKGKIKAESDMKIIVSFSALEKVEISGASTLTNKEGLTFNDFELKSSGASKIDLSLKSNTLNLKTSGASDVKLKGNTQEFSVNASGATNVKAKEFEANIIRVTASGASNLFVNAKQEISGSVSGASDVKVLGGPMENKLITSEASDVKNVSHLKLSVGSNDAINDDELKATGDTTRIKVGSTQVLFINDSNTTKKDEKKRRNHWAGIDLGMNGFLNNQGSFNLNHDASLELTDPKKVTQFMEVDYSKSWTLGLNFYEHYFKIYQHHFGFVTGLGLEYNNYELKHNVRLIQNGGLFVSNNVNSYNENYTWGIVDSAVSFSKNRFKTFYIDAPLLFEINTGNHKNKSFHLSAGAIVGYKFTSRMKYIYKENDNDQKIKDDQNFNTNPFKVSLTARAGIGRFNVFATYSLTPLFETGRGPELYPFSAGITLVGF